MLRGYEIIDILKNRIRIKNLNVYIYSLQDKIPKPFSLPTALIINTDMSKYGDGEHWVAIYVDKKKNVFYFDSFGVILDPIYQNIVSWGECFSSMLYNKRHLQHPFSTLCGGYCVMFIFCMSNGYSFSSFLNLFGNDFRLNDALVRGFISKI